MRLVRLDKDSVVKEEPGGATVQGIDDVTGDMVTFTMTLSGATTVNQGIMKLHHVLDNEIISVEPVRGEWDSPGTSPEEG